MQFGPLPSDSYLPYNGRQAYSYLAPRPPSCSDSPLFYLDLSCKPSESYTLPILGGKSTDYVRPLDVVTDELDRERVRDPIDRFFAAKKAFLVDSVEETLGLIYEREHLKYENIQKIDDEECRMGIQTSIRFA